MHRFRGNFLSKLICAFPSFNKDYPFQIENASFLIFLAPRRKLKLKSTIQLYLQQKCIHSQVVSLKNIYISFQTLKQSSCCISINILVTQLKVTSHEKNLIPHRSTQIEKSFLLQLSNRIDRGNPINRYSILEYQP